MRWMAVVLIVGGCVSDLGLSAALKRRESRCHPVVGRTLDDPMTALRAEQRRRPYPIRVTRAAALDDGVYRIDWTMEHAGERAFGVQLSQKNADGSYDL